MARRDYRRYPFVECSVTEATGAFPKPFLEGWAAKMTALRAVDNYRRLGEMIEQDGEDDALRWLKNARYADRNTKANRGTVVHAAVEAYLAGMPLDNETLDAQLKKARVLPHLWAGAAGMVGALMTFLDDTKPEVVWSEQKVYSRTHGYAGTVDLVARMLLEILDDEGAVVEKAVVPVVLDVKTSKSIYDETAMQLCAYARAEFVGLEDKSEVPLLDEPIRHGVVVRPMTDGTYETAIFDLTDDVFDLFLACKAFHVAVGKDARKGQDVLAASRRAEGLNG